MKLKDALEKRSSLIQEIKIFEAIDEFLEDFLSKDNREPQRYITADNEKYVTEEIIFSTKQKLSLLCDEIKVSLQELEESNVG